MTIKNIMQLAHEIQLTCGNCAYFKTSKCDQDPALTLFNDRPCQDGLLIQLFKTDVLVKQGETTLIKPIRFLSSTKTKAELLQNFDLTDQDVEALILYIKMRTTQKEENNKDSKPTKQEPAISPELQEKAVAILKDTNITENFIKNQDRYLCLDETVRKLILLVCCSAYGNYPLNLSLQQVFSAGKTTTTTQTAKYFPNTWFLGALSPKALIHMKGDYEEEREGYIIDLQGKIIVFLDEPQFETLQMLKPLLSHDQFETEYRYVDKQSGETVKAVLKGWPSVVFCTTKSKYIMEFSSRWLTASPETSVIKIQKVITAKGAKASQTQQQDPEFETWQTAFKLLSKETPLKVVIPYANELAQCFRAKQPIDMRFFDLFLALIESNTILHTYQRTKDQNSNLTATMQDYEEAYKVFHEIERSTTLGLGQNILDFFQNIIMPIWEERKTMTSDMRVITYEDLAWKHEETYEEAINRNTIRETYLKPLERANLIDIEDDTKDKRKKTITVKDTIPETSLINDAKFREIIMGRAGCNSIVL